MKRILKSILVSLLCIMGADVSAQPGPATDSQQPAVQHNLNLFYVSLGKQSPLYNGTQYFFYDPRFVGGSAYFNDVQSFENGDIFYDGLRFNGVPMLYDLYKDAVVILLYNHFTKVQLIKSKVAWFNCLGHHFVNINTDSLGANTTMKPGFYDELYNGKIQILVKHIKTIQATGSNTGTTAIGQYFEANNQYYVKKGNSYYAVHSKHSFLNVLKDKRKQLNQFIRSAQIDFDSDRGAAMVKIASRYDHLNN